MPSEYEIVLRHSSAGWLGILMIEGKEHYRTGTHQQGPVAALTAVQFWMQSNL
ncbi:MAG: hypothetical protein ABSB40_13600 [Nitrososphaeria archaeon]